MNTKYEEINRKIREKLKNKPFLIATHRGTPMGVFVENTINAYRACFAFHSDIAEMDVIRNADGEYYCIHDGTESRILNVNMDSRIMTSAQLDSLGTFNNYNRKTGYKLDRFEDVLKTFRGTDALFNLDRCWVKKFDDFSYTEGALNLIGKYNMYENFIFKTPFNEDFFRQLEDSGCPVPYLVIINSVEQIEIVEKYNFNLIGFELIFLTEEDAIIQDDVTNRLRDKGYLLLANSEMIKETWNVSALHDDSRAVLEGPDKVWGYFVNKGFNIILTDIPWYLNDYRETLSK